MPKEITNRVNDEAHDRRPREPDCRNRATGAVPLPIVKIERMAPGTHSMTQTTNLEFD
jgi:hypothetical protein